MNILDLVSACGDKGLANIIKIAKTVLLIIQICGPILAIIGLVTVLFKLMSNPENKKLKNAFKNCSCYAFFYTNNSKCCDGDIG